MKTTKATLNKVTKRFDRFVIPKGGEIMGSIYIPHDAALDSVTITLVRPEKVSKPAPAKITVSDTPKGLDSMIEKLVAKKLAELLK